MRGAFKKKKAKVASVDLRNSLVTLEGLQISKKDGTKVNVSFHPSRLQIVSLDLSDKKRLAVAQRKTGTPQTSKKPVEKTSAVKETKVEKTTNKKGTK